MTDSEAGCGWGVGGASARVWVEGVRDVLWLLSLARQLGNFHFQKLPGISCRLRALCSSTQMHRCAARPPVSPALGELLKL